MYFEGTVNAEELMALAKAEGVDITKEEAEAYLAELADFELNDVQLRKVAGGGDYCYTDGCALRVKDEDTCKVVI